LSNTGITDYNDIITSLTTSGTNILAGNCHSHLYLSTNNGSNWSNENLELAGYCIDALTGIGTDIFVSYKFLGQGGQTFYNIALSKDTAQSWLYIYHENYPGDIYSIIKSDTITFLGGMVGVLVSYKLLSFVSMHWIEANTGFTSTPTVKALAIFGENIFAGTSSSGIWKRPLFEMTTGLSEISDHNLITAFPNPAIDKISIEVNTIDKNANLLIYNIHGQLLTQQKVYRKKTDIDISGFAKGIYFVVYHKPANDKLTIVSLLKSTIEILNIQGQTIMQQQIQQGKTDIDISGLAKGLYILRLNNNDKTKVTKFLKE